MTTFNLTVKRREALRFVAKKPKGVSVGSVAEHVLAQTYDNGKQRPMWSQAATRLGAGYCQKLVEAGLLTMVRTDVGFADVTITEEGRKAINAD